MEQKQIPHGLAEKYTQFADILVNNLFFIKTLAFLIDQAEYDPFATALVNISIPTLTTLSVIKELIEGEFERNFRTPGSILRGNCVASKIMGAFSRKAGANFIKDCIGDFVLSVATDPDLSLEIDPQKLNSNVEKANQNAALLQDKSLELFSKITDPNSIKSMPDEIKMIAGFTAEFARIYCSDRLLPLTGGFIMLRLFNPSLVTPEAFGIIPEGKKITSQGRRNLTLITKLLQNLSNGVLFGSKEQYMVSMNKFIEDNQQRMNEYLARLTNSSQEIGKKEGWKVNPKPLEIDEVPAKDLLLIHQLVYNYKNKLLDQMQTELTKFPEKEFQEEELFFQILDELGPPLSQSSSRKANLLDSTISFLTPPEKSGILIKRKSSMSLSSSKRYWTVLAGSFLHFFFNPQETVPRKSIALDELLINVNGDVEGTCFSITYYRKDHLLYCQTQEEVDDWVNAILQAKEKHSRNVNKKSVRNLRPIEVRIRNQIHGLKLDYDIALNNYKSLPNRRIVFMFEVEAFEYKFILKKYYTDLLNLHNTLTNNFPKLIFPVFPRKIGEGENDMPLGRYNNRTSFAVIIACKFLRAYLFSIKSNLSVYQSEAVLDFTGLSCPVTAVQANRIDYLSSLLQSKVDLNKHHSETGLTALHTSVLLENEEIARWLLTCSAVHINSKDNEGNTPLFLAIKYGKTKMFHLLLEHGADFKIKNNARMSSLHIAAQSGDLSMCEILIEKGVKLNDLNEKKKVPLYYAITHHHSDVARSLFQRGADPLFIDGKGNNLLHRAVISEEYDIAEFLIKLQVLDVNSAGEHKATPLHMAAATGNEEMVSLLLSHKADIYSLDIQSQTPVYIAVKRGHAEVIRIINESSQINVSESHNGFTLFHQAVLNGHSHLVPILSQIKCDINSTDNKGRTPLMLATLMNNANVVKELLDASASANIYDQKKRTPLYVASYRGYDIICQLLLSKYANPEITDPEGSTPLHVAIWGNQVKTAKFLLIRGANPNHREFVEGNTPLHTVVRCNAVSVGILLLQHGADVNSKRKVDGNTPLHMCVDYGCKTIAKYIMEAPKFKLNTCNKSDLNPLQYAAHKGDEDFAHFIKNFVAEGSKSRHSTIS